MAHWFRTLLSALAPRPAMLLGDSRLESLRAYISGYRRAHDHLGVPLDETELKEFGRWLSAQYDTGPDWYGASRRLTAARPQTAVCRLVDLYRAHLAETDEQLIEPMSALRMWVPQPNDSEASEDYGTEASLAHSAEVATRTELHLLRKLQQIDETLELIHADREAVLAELARVRRGLEVRNPARRKALVDRIVELMDSQPDLAWTADELVEALSGENSKASISTTLSNLARDGRIDKVSRGLYQSVYAEPEEDE